MGCWKIETSYEWIEFLGHNNHSFFDFSNHIEASGAKLVAIRILKYPKVISPEGSNKKLSSS